MGAHTNIEWADSTFNAWLGCRKVSPGCDDCYIVRTPALRFRGMIHGSGRHRTGEETWKNPRRWNQDVMRECQVCGKRAIFPASSICCGAVPAPTRQRIFSLSLGDWLDNEVPIEWLADLLELIHATPNLDWLLLTKRPQNWLPRMCEAFELVGESRTAYHERKGAYLLLEGWLSEKTAQRPPHNVWIGTSVEDQKRADQRIPKLLEIPAAIRFLSCEPLLDPVDLEGLLCRYRKSESLGVRIGGRHTWEGIDWVIAGGESGPRARPMHPDWVRSLRDQCQSADVAFFFKQWGEFLHERVIAQMLDAGTLTCPQLARSKFHITIENENFFCLGKKLTGRLLDGQVHNGFPDRRARGMQTTNEPKAVSI